MTNTSLENARIEHVIRRAAIAAVIFDPVGAKALLAFSDAEIGRRFKTKLWEVVGVATIYNLDLPAIRNEEQSLSRRIDRASKRRTTEHGPPNATVLGSSDGLSLVRQGKILRAIDFCEAAGLTEKKLNKNVASGRLFSFDVGRESYIPAFFLPSVIDRNDLARVIRRLRDASGSKKWEFFTTPIGPEGGSTPLQLLANKEVKRVLVAAEGFMKRSPN
ncbi:hypothetical protein [Caballeronia concitans]|uniref:Uncharacterized protein n=1 Tax=Caballeronia concitans TaxID=1777133 RepID=A0A658R594_9BURK|nr:hypothetical protein [Caballeronia concitans]SAL51207.1 hypothetical protein AWB72_05411 [Caballeronia concitans]